MDVYHRLTYSDAQDENIKRENANVDGDTAMGTMLKYGSEGSKYFIIKIDFVKLFFRFRISKR